MDVYQDRIPRWKNDMYPSVIVDSCNNTGRGPFVVAGMQTLSFSGVTSTWCSWSCPTLRETKAIEFMQRVLTNNCSFVLKITGKYWTPHLLPQIAKMSNSTELIFQHGISALKHVVPSEIFGMSRKMLGNFLRLYRKSSLSQESRLFQFVRRLNASNELKNMNVLKKMKLYNFTRRSDGRILTWL